MNQTNNNENEKKRKQKPYSNRLGDVCDLRRLLREKGFKLKGSKDSSTSTSL